MAVISLITGAPGTGKSYYVVNRIKFTLEALPSVRIRTNLPLAFEEWGVLKSRVEIIGDAGWKNESRGGPWEIDDWRDVLFVLDECHNFICSPRVKHWHEWLGECRHRGVYGVWLITQSPKKVPQLVDVGLWVELQRPEEFRGKLTGVPLGVIWQWLSYIRGRRYSLACAFEYLQERGRNKPNKVQWLPIHPDGYRLYNSYSTPEKGGLSGACAEPWQLGFKALLLHTISESWFGLALRAALGVLFYIGIQAVFAIPGAILATTTKAGNRKQTDAAQNSAFASDTPQPEPQVQTPAPKRNTEHKPKPEVRKRKERLKAWLQGSDDVKAEIVPLPETPDARKDPSPVASKLDFELLHSSP